jgi:arylsulfatase A-like enzyme
LAVKLLQTEKLGKQAASDVLLLQYTVRPPKDNTSALGSAEKEDMYLRLDKDLSLLLSEIDKTAGISNTLLFLTANQTDSHSPEELKAHNIPSGKFSPNRAVSLLNIYLMALYGHEPWVEGYYGRNIYLNREKIEDKKLNLHEFQQVAADFMLEFEGIQATYTAAQVLSMSSETSRLRNSYTKLNAGDVVISLQPGWVEVDAQDKPVGSANAAICSVPLYVFGWKTPQQTINTPYQITDIAPTLCKILNIPAPNANTGTAIPELVQKF